MNDEQQPRMAFDLQPTLKGSSLELKPLRAEGFHDLFAVAADPLVWEQHPIRIVTRRRFSWCSSARL